MEHFEHSEEWNYRREKELRKEAKAIKLRHNKKKTGSFEPNFTKK